MGSWTFGRSPAGPRHAGALACLLLGAGAGGLPACESYFTQSGTDGGSADVDAGATKAETVAGVPVFAGLAIGVACKLRADCRAGLDCVAGKCAANHTSSANAACLMSDECATSLHCSFLGFCTPQPAGAAKAGMFCDSTADCSAGLYCNIKPDEKCTGAKGCGACTAATAAAPAPEGEECTSTSGCPAGMVCDMAGMSGTCKTATGKGDLGTVCKATSECAPGLACSKTSLRCVPGSLTLNPDLFSGVECRDVPEAGESFRALVEIPRASTASDFYALPFPSDVRKKGGKIDVSAHPSPGLGFVGMDATKRVMDALSSEYEGWGLTGGMYLRFTRAIDEKSLGAVDAKTKVIKPGKADGLRLYDATTGKQVENLFAKFTAERNKYICRNWLYVHTRWSDILEPKHTYVLVVTDAVRAAATAAGDKTPVQGKDLAALLAAAAPGDPDLKAAYEVYKPVRELLPKVGLPASKVMAAAVFTTMEPRDVTAQLATLSAGALPPGELKGAVLCEKGTVSPCGTTGFAGTEAGKAGKADSRGCPLNPNPLIYEIHARIQLPVYQSGTRPYLESGGGVSVTNGKVDAKVTYEDVCISVTIPKAQMPAAGWPMVLFAHGTNGSFRSHVDTMAPVMSNLQVTGGPLVRAATVGIDGPMHGSRRGAGVDLDPGMLFYNFANPPAAKGNFYQGAADNFTLFRWAKGYGGTLPVAGKIKFDAANLVYFGHSQGATTGPLALPFIPELKGAVLSGSGGSLVFGLLGKKLPIDASIGLRVALQEIKLDEYHPVLNLMQIYFEPSDPLLYAEFMYRKQANLAGLPWHPIHLLHTYGHGDNFTPPTTSRIFAAAVGNTAATTTSPDQANWYDNMADLGVKTAPPPIEKNVTGAGGQILTGVTVQAKNDPNNSLFKVAYDGHFVAFNDLTLLRQVSQYVGNLIAGTPKAIP
ncbi:MAG: hypothetical protein EXR79_02495 [Myxococcales bacterium]|nr:hypothetical protein [Myxococcales bacterium]